MQLAMIAAKVHDQELNNKNTDLPTYPVRKIHCDLAREIHEIHFIIAFFSGNSNFACRISQPMISANSKYILSETRPCITV